MTKKIDRLLTINLCFLTLLAIVLIVNEVYAFYINIQGCGI
jgi:hypothetical protein